MPADLDPRPIRNSDHHYVILVHGTFNKPEPLKPHWAVLDPDIPISFAHRLNEQLRGTRIGPAVNALPGGGVRTFAWDAGNSDVDRRAGAAKLLQDIVSITAADPNARIHLVGHSHGGNVILAALESYYDILANRADHYSAIPWVLWKWGDARGGFLNDQPMDLEAAAAGLVERIRERGETLRGRAVRFLQGLLIEPRTDVDPVDPEATRWRQCYCASPTTNRLGRVVFLGTPFFGKRWRRRNLIEWTADTVFNATGLALYWGAVGYVLATILLVLPSLIVAVGAGWNPLAWPLVAQGLYFLFVAFNTYRGFRGDTRRNGNVYWNRMPIERYSLDGPLYLESVRKNCDGRLSALTVTAPYLDEALLGMMSEPLILGRLRPELRRFVAPASTYRSDSGVASGVRFNRMVAMRRLLDRVVQRLKTTVVYGIYLILKVPWRFVYDRMLERFVVNAVFGAISATTTGLPRAEYAGAVIEPSECANVPGLLNETVLDATEAFLRPAEGTETTIAQAAPRTAAEAYAFLNNDAELRRLLAEDSQWQTIQEEQGRLARFYQRIDISAFGDDLARRWLAIRTRLATILENIALTHGRYYADERVIQAIAEFIAEGRISTMPSTSSEFIGKADPPKDRTPHAPAFTARPTSLDNVDVTAVDLSVVPGAGKPTIALKQLLDDLVWVGEVAITRGFVTTGQYRMMLDDVDPHPDCFFFPEHWRGPSPNCVDHEPVGGVRPTDADHFCRWLGEQFSGKLEFRLPTRQEAEVCPPTTRSRLCWCSDFGVYSCVGSPSPLRRYREARRAIPASRVRLPDSKFLLPVRGITTVSTTAPPVNPMIVDLVSLGVFGRLPPADLFRLPASLGSVSCLIDDLQHTRRRIVEARAYGARLFLTLIDGLASDPNADCARAFKVIATTMNEGYYPHELAIALAPLKNDTRPVLAHTAQLVGDLSQTLFAESDVEAFGWLQVVAARALEYGWHAHEWHREAQRRRSGKWAYLTDEILKRVTGRGGDNRHAVEEVWSLYWWLRFCVARGNGEIPAFEGIRVVCESTRSDVEGALRSTH